MGKSGKCCVLKSLSQRNPPVQIRRDAGMRQEVPSSRGGLTSGPSLCLESCRGGFSFPGAARGRLGGSVLFFCIYCLI